MARETAVRSEGTRFRRRVSWVMLQKREYVGSEAGIG